MDQPLSYRAAEPPIAAYSVESFTRTFGIGRSRVFAEIASGRLRARKVGARTIIAHDDAMAWLSALPERSTASQPSS